MIKYIKSSIEMDEYSDIKVVDEFFTKRNYNPRCIQNFNRIKEYLK